MLRLIWSSSSLALDLGLLAMRAVAGLLLMPHGWAKLMSFSERAEKFPDPLGVGHTPSLILIIFAELICSFFLVLGLFSRPVLVPLIIAMSVIVFVIHGSDPPGEKESAILYLMTFTALFFAGPGKYSLDKLLRR